MIVTRMRPASWRHAVTSIELPDSSHSSRWNAYVGVDVRDEVAVRVVEAAQRLAERGHRPGAVPPTR